MFPIFDTADEFRKEGRRRIELLPTAEQATIEGLQVYNAGDFDWTPQYLRTLNRLANIDKHRHLHVIRRAVAMYPAEALPPNLTPEVTIEDHSFKKGAYVGRWAFPRPVNMYVDTVTVLRVSISEVGETLELIPWLRGCQMAVADVLERFHGVLPAN